MAEHTALPLPALPVPVDRLLRDFTETACHALGSDLHSIVLYGSAAEGRLRPTSDVNVILVLSKFCASQSGPPPRPPSCRSSGYSFDTNVSAGDRNRRCRDRVCTEILGHPATPMYHVRF